VKSSNEPESQGFKEASFSNFLLAQYGPSFPCDRVERNRHSETGLILSGIAQSFLQTPNTIDVNSLRPRPTYFVMV
jgi:hypothetical protein